MNNSVSVLSHLMSVTSNSLVKCPDCGGTSIFAPKLYVMAAELKSICMSIHCTQKQTPEKRMLAMVDIFESVRFTSENKTISFRLVSIEEYQFTHAWLSKIGQLSRNMRNEYLDNGEHIIHTNIKIFDWLKWLYKS